ncbi:MAG: precorrin-4 C(11)-methyltransferase [Chloroflexi bacterium]|nr:precorrin-4 C(11)-methyltransferase [Chloroflexota bacterium]
MLSKREPQVFFIGAGPGDPELLTLKGKRLIQSSDVIIYADSLVNQSICSFAKEGAEVFGSASMTLEEIAGLIRRSVAAGKRVARIHTGDPSLYSAILEQMALLDQEGICYEVVPGVTAVFAAAASLETELTAPEMSQTVIISRLAGRTPVPEREDLRSLASHHCTMALYLTTGMIERAVSELIAGGYPQHTPAAVVYRASWEDEKIVRGTLEDIAAKTLQAGVKQQALILVGRVLDPLVKSGARSKLYDGAFSHQFRPAGEKDA